MSYISFGLVLALLPLWPPCMPLQVLELDVMDVHIVEERSYAVAIETSPGSQDSYAAHIQRKHFLYFTDEKIFSALMEICRTLGTSAFPHGPEVDDVQHIPYPSANITLFNGKGL